MAGLIGYTKQDNERDAAAGKAYWDKVAAQRGGIAAPPISAEEQARNASYLKARQLGGIAAEGGLRARNIVGDIGSAIGTGAGYLKSVTLDPAAQFLKTAVTGDPGSINSPVAQPNAVTVSPGQVATAAKVQPQQPAAPVSAPSFVPSMSGGVPSGTGFIRNTRTGKTTQIGGAPSDGSGTIQNNSTGNTTQFAGGYLAPSRAYITPTQLAAENAAAGQIGQYASLMNREGGGIGEGIAARGALNQAGVLGGIAAQQSAAGTARKNADTTELQHGIAAQVSMAALNQQKKLQALYDKLNASTDKTERAKLLQDIYALSGKPQQERYLAMQDPSTTDALGNKIEGAKYWMDPNTGQILRGDGGAQPQARPVTKAELSMAAKQWGISEAAAADYIKKVGGTIE